MQYKDVVRDMFRKYPNKAPKEVMRMAAAHWRSVKGSGVSAGALSHSVRKPRSVKGGGVIGDVGHTAVGIADKLGDLFGLGLEGGKHKRGRKVRGGGVIGDVGHTAVDVADKLGDLFGLGMQHKGKRRGRKVRGAGISGGSADGGSLLSLLGLGLDKPHGGGVSGGVAADGGSLLSFLGLGLDKKKHKSPKGGSLLDIFGLGLDQPHGGYVSAGSYYRNPSIGTVQPLQPSLDMSKGGDFLSSAMHVLPFMALL